MRRDGIVLPRPSASLPRTGHVIFHANCPVVWHSKLQSTISLLTAEAECAALPTAMRDAICFVNLIQEIQEQGITLPHKAVPKMTCKVFEDNAGALELASNHKLRPRTKHLAVQLHHFRQCTLGKKVIVDKSTQLINEQMCLPKPCLEKHFVACEVPLSVGKTLQGSAMSRKS